MNDYLLQGDKIEWSNRSWIVIQILNSYCLLVERGVKRTKLMEVPVDVLFQAFESGTANLLKEERESHEIIQFDTGGTAGNINERIRRFALDVRDKDVNLNWLLDREEKARFVKESGEKYQVSENTIRRMLLAYLQNGMQLTGIGCRYSYCGGRGKSKRYQLNKRPGRQGLSQVVRNDEVILQFDTMLKRYQRTKTKLTQSMLYEDLCKQYYSTRKVINGEDYYEIYPAVYRPTKKQLSYYLRTHVDSVDKYIAQKGFRKAWNNIRPLHSDTIADLSVKGIGARYEMDEMETDFYLVSRTDPNQVIGRAILYLIIDVYSKMFTGFYVGLDNNSWAGAELALLNMAESKAEICRRANIEISEGEWPVSGVLPSQILVDNGSEYLSSDFEKYAQENGIALAFTPAAMGSLKPNIEQEFHQFNLRTKGRLPGEIEKDVYGRPHLNSARLNIDDFYQIVIRFILTHNKNPMPNYHDDKVIFSSGIDTSPIEIWRNSLQRENGLQKIKDMEQYRYSLLSMGKATVTREGIVFKHMKYACDDVIWLERQMSLAKLKGHKQIDIRYDKRNMDVIYYVRQGRFYQAWLNHRKTENEKYFECTYEECLFINEHKKQKATSYYETRLENNINLSHAIDIAVKEAKHRHKGSNSKKNILDYRNQEKSRLHEEDRVVLQAENRNFDHRISDESIREEAQSIKEAKTFESVIDPNKSTASNMQAIRLRKVEQQLQFMKKREQEGPDYE